MVRKQIVIQVAVAAVVLLAAVGMTCFLCKARNAPKDRPAVIGIRYEVITAVDVDENFETAGTLKARTVSEVASRVMGTVTALKVKQGDAVKAGDVLLEIDDKDLSQRYKGAQAAHDEATKSLDAARERQSLAETTYARYKTLAQQNAIAQQQFDEIASQKKLADSEYARAMAAVAGAESNLQDTKVTLGYARVTAPTNGVVTWRSAEVGSMAHPGEKLITVEDTSQFTVDINVDERLSGTLKIGMPVDVNIEAIGLKVTAEVAEVVPSVDPTSRTFLVKLKVPSMDKLCSGLHASVLIRTGSRKAMLVPEKSVIKKGQLTGIYVIGTDNIIGYRLVRTGKSQGDKIEVLSGLGDGEKVITDGMEKAVDGGILGAGGNN